MSKPSLRAPELQLAAWLNTREPLSLAALRGKVVAIHAFQMLCPACVSHGIPQANAIRNAFSEEEVAVIGLHTVFEHHDVMGRRALEAFIHEYRLRFPVAIDMPSDSGPVPLTMARYQLQGTPSLLLIDKEGYLRFSHFGHVDDMRVGALIGKLIAEAASGEAIGSARAADASSPSQAGCDDMACHR